jgi:hypothetical protein
VFVLGGPVALLRAGPDVAPLVAAEREAIELLNARYSLALGSCNAEGYANLFAEPNGWFASGGRGRVQGHAKLVELVRSYDCAYSDTGVAPPHAPAVEVPYRLDLRATTGGAAGTIYVKSGFYEDVYVKTPRGWRFGSRTVISNTERAAKLSAADFAAIRQLADRAGGPYADVYEPIDSGWRFKSAGVTIQPAAAGATGIAYLANDGGRYEDAYARTPNGWRFQSRTFVPQGADAARLQLRGTR